MLRHRNDVNLGGITEFAVEQGTGVKVRCHHFKTAVTEQRLERRARHGGRRDLYADPRVCQRGVAARLEVFIRREPGATSIGSKRGSHVGRRRRILYCCFRLLAL